MMSCYLCLEEDSVGSVGIYSEIGVSLDISEIISKHFWLLPDKITDSKETLCLPCWDALQCFHTFYLRVAEAHNYLQSKIDAPTILIEDDPLPQETHLKTENININNVLGDTTIGDDFFDSEVKVEVQDLDLLPQAEVIEETSSLTERAARASRRNKSSNENSNESPNTHTKQIKCEESPVADDVKNESEREILLVELVPIELKTDYSVENVETECQTREPSAINTATQKKKRGRPKKIKEEPDELLKPNENKSMSKCRSNSKTIKTENPELESSDEDADREFMETNHGTNGSSRSISDSNESDNSWNYQPYEKYAEIPKRVVIKPKKYRKRPKPAIPPKRLSREEIERKHAQQAEYDKIIAKFFEKFSCPRCNLLVQNFGEMKAHFRVSHNDDIGYMSCCGRKFHLRKTLAEHVLVHWNPEHFKCPTCLKIFQDSRALEIHEQSHTCPNDQKDKKTFQCDKCPKAFTTKAAFEYHSFSKHVPRSEFQFSCTECNKKFPTKRKLKDHIKYAHDPESAVICDKCGKQMRNQSSLKKHHEIEHSDKPRPVPVPMQCEICGTWLRHAAGLKQHMKTIHEDTGGEHRCHICNKTSTNARALKRHIYHNHECERKFKCTMCEKAFKRPQDLREHTSTHTGEVLYTCPNCPMTFFSNANMYKHRQRLHRAEWETDKKKPRPPNIMGQAVSATAAMKMKQAVGAANAFFANKITTQTQKYATNSHIGIN